MEQLHVCCSGVRLQRRCRNRCSITDAYLQPPRFATSNHCLALAASIFAASIFAAFITRCLHLAASIFAAFITRCLHLCCLHLCCQHLCCQHLCCHHRVQSSLDDFCTSCTLSSKLNSVQKSSKLDCALTVCEMQRTAQNNGSILFSTNGSLCFCATISLAAPHSHLISAR